MTAILSTSNATIDASHSVIMNTDGFKKIISVFSAVFALITLIRPNPRLLKLNPSIQNFQDMTAIVGVVKGSKAFMEEVNAKSKCKDKILPIFANGMYTTSYALSFIASLDALQLVNLGKSAPRIGLAADLLMGAVTIMDLCLILSTFPKQLKEASKEKRIWKQLHLEITQNNSATEAQIVKDFAKKQIADIQNKKITDKKIEKQISCWKKLNECENPDALKKYIEMKAKQTTREKSLLIARNIIDIALDVTAIALIIFSVISLVLTGGLTLPLLIITLAVNSLDLSSFFMKEYLIKKLKIKEPNLDEISR